MMNTEPDWHGNVSFSDRFANISRIAAALENKAGISPAEARQRAKDTEGSFYSEASTADEYDLSCNQAATPPTWDQSDEQLDQNLVYELIESDVTIGKYTNVNHFRDGLFSFVYTARAPSESEPNVDGHVVALKVTTPSMMEKPHDSQREARILEAVRHPRIIPLIDLFQQHGGRLILVFPFMPFDLRSLLEQNKIDQKQVRDHLQDMFKALEFIHSRGYIHRDIKPSNLLLHTPSGPAYLADFGIAWSPEDVASEPSNDKITDVGTTCYRPPELLFGNRKYGCALDLWAAGCTVAEANSIDGNTLFDSGELGSELALIQSVFTSLGTPTSDAWPEAKEFPDWGKMSFREYPTKPWTELLPDASQEARSLVSGLVKFESSARLTASKALGHPYFTNASS